VGGRKLGRPGPRRRRGSIKENSSSEQKPAMERGLEENSGERLLQPTGGRAPVGGGIKQVSREDVERMRQKELYNGAAMKVGRASARGSEDKYWDQSRAGSGGGSTGYVSLKMKRASREVGIKNQGKKPSKLRVAIVMKGKKKGRHKDLCLHYKKGAHLRSNSEGEKNGSQC